MSEVMVDIALVLIGMGLGYVFLGTVHWYRTGRWSR